MWNVKQHLVHDTCVSHALHLSLFLMSLPRNSSETPDFIVTNAAFLLHIFTLCIVYSCNGKSTNAQLVAF